MTDKKRTISLIVTASLFVLLLVVYLAAILPLSKTDVDTSSEQIVLESWEEIGLGNTLLMSKRADRVDIESIYVENEHGEYTFKRKTTTSGETFVLDGFEQVEYSSMAFSSLVVTTGVPTASGRVTESATEEDLARFGLDEPQAKWKVTTVRGESYEVAVGNKMITGEGYYAMRSEYPTHVYILSTTVEDSVLQPVESILNPILCAGINTNNYTTADDFKLSFDGVSVVEIRQRDKSEFYNPDAQVETQLTYPGSYKTDDTFFLGVISILDTYNVESSETASTDESFEAMEAVYLGDDPEQLRKYGLNDYYYNLSFTVKAEVGSSIEYTYDLKISDLQEDGYYYAVSNHYDYKLIMKCPKAMFDWLTLKSYENGEPKVDLINWIDEDPIMLNIAYVDSIMLDIPDLTINYSLVHGTDADGNATLEIKADNGFEMSNHDVYIFRNYYKVMLGVKFMADGDLSDADIERITSDESKHLATIRFTMKDGTVNEYKFYRDTTRRALMTANGDGEFYVLADWIEKLISDTDRLLAGLEIDATTKN